MIPFANNRCISLLSVLSRSLLMRFSSFQNSKAVCGLIVKKYQKQSWPCSKPKRKEKTYQPLITSIVLKNRRETSFRKCSKKGISAWLLRKKGMDNFIFFPLVILRWWTPTMLLKLQWLFHNRTSLNPSIIDMTKPGIKRRSNCLKAKISLSLAISNTITKFTHLPYTTWGSRPKERSWSQSRGKDKDKDIRSLWRTMSQQDQKMKDRTSCLQSSTKFHR